MVGNDIVQDVYNILSGVYAPLVGFLREDDFLSVLHEMRLTAGDIWSIPIVLDIRGEDYLELKDESEIMLIDALGRDIAILKNIQIYPYDKGQYAFSVFGTTDDNHPGVASLMGRGSYLVGGDIYRKQSSEDEICDACSQAEILRDFSEYYFSPKETKQIFKDRGWESVVAFQTRNVPHRSHEYLQKLALKGVDGIMIQPVIGKKKPGDFRDDVIIEAYNILFDNYYDEDRAFLNILPLKMNYAGPREAVHHAVIRRNYGCTHMIIGRDHAGVGDYYDSYEAHDIFDNFTEYELGIKILKYENVSHCHGCGELKVDGSCEHADRHKFHISGTKMREMIKNGEELPEELIRKEISEYLLNHPNPFV